LRRGFPTKVPQSSTKTFLSLFADEAERVAMLERV
jgi:hypothetical protein